MMDSVTRDGDDHAEWRHAFVTFGNLLLHAIREAAPAGFREPSSLSEASVVA